MYDLNDMLRLRAQCSRPKNRIQFVMEPNPEFMEKLKMLEGALLVMNDLIRELVRTDNVLLIREAAPNQENESD